VEDAELTHHWWHGELVEGIAHPVASGVPGGGRRPDVDRANAVVGRACEVQNEPGDGASNRMLGEIVVPGGSDVGDDGNG